MGHRISMLISTNEQVEWLPGEPIAAGISEIQRAMNALPSVELQILTLWSGGMTYREIAEQTHRSQEEVGVYLAQARNRLVMAYDLLRA